MEPNRQIFSAMKYLSFLTQLGLSIITPILLCILGAVWLQNRFHLGGWVLIVGILLGVGGGCSAFYQFYQFIQREERREKERKEEEKDGQ